MSKIPVDGIYASKSHGVTFHDGRNVYIQNGIVRLVMDECGHLFNYNFFFDVNVLGERLADLPPNYDIRVKGKQP